MWSVSIKLGRNCSDCDRLIPINGPLSRVKCPGCQSTHAVNVKLWRDLLNYGNPAIDVFAATKEHRPGRGDSGAFSSIKLNTLRQWPVCSACGREATEAEVTGALPAQLHSTGSLTCAACKAQWPLHPVPPVLSRAFSAPRFVVGGEVDGDGGADAPRGSRPVVMACMACGSTLRVDGTSRLVGCTFCESDNYLPDDLWLALHPAPKRTAWWILFA